MISAVFRRVTQSNIRKQGWLMNSRMLNSATCSKVAKNNQIRQIAPYSQLGPALSNV